MSTISDKPAPWAIWCCIPFGAFYSDVLYCLGNAGHSSEGLWGESMYGAIVYLHIAGVFLFLLGHGGSANAAFQIKHERNPDRLRALLDMSVWSYSGMYVGLLLLLLTGIIA